MFLSKAALSVVLVLASSALATPLIPNIGERVYKELEARQAGNFIAVVGARTGAIQPRLEVRQLERNADQWNIYLLGLQRMQAKSQDDPLSWYQIAGIHGRPFTTYDGVEAGPGLNNHGYCTHSSNLFATWHRPYLALYEQALYANVLDAVNSFPAGATRDRYAAAAQTFRIPYWDWAVAPPNGQSSLPDSVTRVSTTVITPSGTQSIANPLYAYRFNPDPSQLGGAPYSQWPTTLRYPTSQSINAQSQDGNAAQQLNSNRLNWRDRLYSLLMLYTQFNQFSNEAWITRNTQNADSIESLHDSVHGVSGNGGHMSFIDIAAFDPLFMLHHAMVDRCAALWQALNPSSYVEPAVMRGATYTIQSNSVLDVNSPLTPFHSNRRGTFWTSRGVRFLETFGYTYPELANFAQGPAVRTSINNLYGPSARLTAKRSVDDNTASPAPGTLTRDYFANIKANRFGLAEGSYFVYLFIGKPSADPAKWSVDPNLVGTHVVFSHSKSADMDMGEVLVTGVVPLTTTLKKYVLSGELASLKEADVVPFLTSRLQWSLALVDDTPLPCEQAPGFSVEVAGVAIQLPASVSDAPSRVGDVTPYPAITKGKVGGNGDSNSY